MIVPYLAAETPNRESSDDQGRTRVDAPLLRTKTNRRIAGPPLPPADRRRSQGEVV
jgi:hypothetical protein